MQVCSLLDDRATVRHAIPTYCDMITGPASRVVSLDRGWGTAGSYDWAHPTTTIARGHIDMCLRYMYMSHQPSAQW